MIQVLFFLGESLLEQGLLIENPLSVFISVQAATDSVCSLQQREQERKKVKVNHLDNGPLTADLLLSYYQQLFLIKEILQMFPFMQ